MISINANKLTNYLNTLFNILIENINNLTSEGKWDSKVDTIKESNKIGTMTTYIRKSWPNGDKVTDTDSAILNIEYILPIQEELTDELVETLTKDSNIWKDSDNLEVNITYTNGQDLHKENLTMKEIMNILEDYKKKYSVDSEVTTMVINQIIVSQSNINSSRNLKISLIKITSNKEIKINLNKITANYELTEAINDVNTIISNDDFIDQLPENQEICYDISSDETDYDVNECEDFDICDAIKSMLSKSLQLQLFLRVITLSARGKTYDCILTLCNSIIYRIDEIMKYLTDALLTTTYCEYIPSFNLVSDEYAYVPDDVFHIIEDNVNDYLQCLDIVYVNLDKGIQSRLDICVQSIEYSLHEQERRLY